MNPTPQRPEDDSLSPKLQEATDAIRNEPLPEEAVQRATERARAIPKVGPRPRPGFQRMVTVLVSMAAAALIAVGVWAFGLYPGGMSKLGEPESDKNVASANPQKPASPPASFGGGGRGDAMGPGGPALAPETPTGPTPGTLTPPITRPTAPPQPGRPGESSTGGGIPGLPGPGGYGGGGTGATGTPIPKPTPPFPGFPGDGGFPAGGAGGPGSVPSRPGGFPGGAPGAEGGFGGFPGGAPAPTPVDPTGQPSAPPGGSPGFPGGTTPSAPPPLPTKPGQGQSQQGGQAGGVFPPTGAVGPNRGSNGLPKGKELRDLATQWGKLPMGDLTKKIDGVLPQLPPAYRDAVKTYMKSVAMAQKENKPVPAPPAFLQNAAPPEGVGGEKYSHYHDNPYHAVSQQALSTFSITVDTASYSNVRRFLINEKRLPPKDAVRVAELINYFPYAYPQPRGEHPVSITANIAQCPWTPKHHLLRVALKAREYTPGDMPPRNFVFLLDTSGSMSRANKLPLLKKSLKMLLETLNESDRVAIVVYAGKPGLVLPPTPGNEKDKIAAALEGLSAGGGTNGGGGIQLAYKVAQENFIEGGLNRVILGTDGDFNVGLRGAELVRYLENKRKTGVYLSILGYGVGNYKGATMEKLAKHGNGTHAYIDNDKEAHKIFVEQGGALVTVAKDVKLQLEFNPQMVAGYRLIGYENRMLEAKDFNDDTKDASEMGAGHTVTALYEIVPAGQPVPDVDIDKLKYQKPKDTTPEADTGEWLTVKLRYKDPEEESSKKLEQAVTGKVTAFDKSPEDFRFAAAVASFGMLLRDSKYAGKTTLAATKEIAESSLGKDTNGHRKAFLEMVEAADKLKKANPGGN